MDAASRLGADAPRFGGERESCSHEEGRRVHALCGSVQHCDGPSIRPLQALCLLKRRRDLHL
jgi:hypothetical protein